MSNPRVSILITTCNRAQHLRPALESLAQTEVPSDLPAELLLMDNGSRDNTREVFDSCCAALLAAGIEPRYLFVAEPGLCRGRNAGVQASRGQAIMITDDDLRVPRNWIGGLARPLVSGQAHAVAGGVAIAPHLVRPWMTDFHRGWLASTEVDKTQHPTEEPGRMVGASINVSRDVFDKVPAFDEELGPGALGFCDDILFSLQVKEAGYKLMPRWQVESDHHFDASRLQPASLLDRARKEGRSTAYLWYHWLHMPVARPQAKAAFFQFKLAAFRARRKPQAEGCSQAEMQLEQKLSCYRQYLIEMKRPRNYEQRGLRKRNLS